MIFQRCFVIMFYNTKILPSKSFVNSLEQQFCMKDHFLDISQKKKLKIFTLDKKSSERGTFIYNLPQEPGRS